MTAWGIGLRLAAVSLGYLLIAAIAHFNDPDLMLMTRAPAIVFPIIGIILIVIGLAMWASGARIIDKAFDEGKLLTSGVYAIVRNPMYSGLIVFVAPGIALSFRSWPLLTVPIVAYIGFRFLIHKEEKYLEDKFGQQYLDYKSNVNSIIPFVRF